MITVDGKIVNVTQFPDGTPKINLRPEQLRPNQDNIINVSWYYKSMDELFTVVAIVNHFYNLQVSVDLDIPYVPNARMDRTNNISEVFTLKWFAGIINSLPINRLKIFDPHSYVTEALFDRCIVVTPKQPVNKIINELIPNTFGFGIDSFFFPDEGAMKRYSNNLDYRPFIFGLKRRDWSTGTIKSFDVAGDLKYITGKNILIIDDICSAGGTFYFSAKKLKDLGANHIFLYISHCEDTLVIPKQIDPEEGIVPSPPINRYNGLIDRVYTTDSIFTGKHEKVEVIKL